MEQGYNDVHTKYSELGAAKSALEKENFALQSGLDDERNAKTHGYEHISQLESKKRY